jgi:hypothetical protein
MGFLGDDLMEAAAAADSVVVVELLRRISCKDSFSGQRLMCVGNAPLPDLSYKTVDCFWTGGVAIAADANDADAALFSRKLVAGLTVPAPLAATSTSTAKEWSLLASIAIVGVVVAMVVLVVLLLLLPPLPPLPPHLGRLRHVVWVLLVCTVLLPPLVMVVVTVVVTRVRLCLGKKPAMRPWAMVEVLLLLLVVAAVAVEVAVGASAAATASAVKGMSADDDMLARRCPTGRSGGTGNALVVVVVDNNDAVAVVVVVGAALDVGALSSGVVVVVVVVVEGREGGR